MKINNVTDLYRLSSYIFTAVLGLAIVFAISGKFKLFMALLLVIFPLSIAIFIFYRIDFKKINITIEDIQVLTVILFAFMLTIVFHHVTLWGGYDHGIYSFSAMELSNTGTLLWNNTYIQLFDGFIPIENTEKYTTHFLPGYISYLAMFYYIGGVKYLFIGNSILLAFSLYSIYSVAKILYSHKVGLLTIILFAFSYTMLWFSRRTLSENLTLFLLWFGIYLLLYYFNKKDYIKIVYSTMPIILLTFVRPEGILFVLSFCIAIISIILIYYETHLINCIKNDGRNIILYSSFIALLTYYYLEYVAINPISLEIWKNIFYIVAKPENVMNVSVLNSGYPTYKDYAHRYLIDVFFAYGLMPLLLVAIISIKKLCNKKLLILLLVIGPSFYFIYDPTIAWTQPWMMRRYYPHVIPLICLLGSFGIISLKFRKTRVCVLAILMILSLIIASPIITLSNDHGTLKQLEYIRNAVDENSIVLFSWGEKAEKIGVAFYFLYGIPTITSNSYDINTTLVNKIIDSNNFEHIYVISNHEDMSLGNDFDIMAHFRIFKDNELKQVEKTTVTTSLLNYESTANVYASPGAHRIKPLLDGYAPIKDSVSRTPPNTITSFNRTFYIYEVIR